MIATPELYSRLLRNPYNKGLRHLKILTGYASSAFLHHVANDLREANIEIIIGMARKDGIRNWDHSEFLRLSQATQGRVSVYYHIGEQSVHAKCLSWNNKSDAPEISFAGSANFSWNGYWSYYETMVQLPVAEDISIAFQSVTPANCLDAPQIECIPLLDMPHNAPHVGSLKELANLSPVVTLNLFHCRGKGGAPIVHERSGLNWGQRPEYRREPDQAYIPIPKKVHQLHPDFFPPRNHEFTIVTDDGQSFIAVIAQDNNKAIETRYDNSIIGRYFRDRLKVERGSPVVYEDLEKYGRNSVSLHKLGEDLYFLDFSI